VARGFTQTEGINYEETFAPVARMTSMYVMFAMSAEQDLELDHMDVMSLGVSQLGFGRKNLHVTARGRLDG
jgi:hypothetical protein